MPTKIRTALQKVSSSLCLDKLFLKGALKSDVYEALATLQYPHIYPDPESRRLRKKLVGLLAQS